ncbi:DUF3617 domain-containing protein [Nitrosomonas sp. JL21]|uniref:DUF3617 domain-containing protein n=1 Tax=Nitrosomonas sp. JL21 TaxID=153949 RepID=UPI001370D57B|nr:DUF3617 domain-containing protein [Nitrosomonas sp. JL21]MBL8497846.1 DUF3617 domain-containing protein [Nitrosomonas sp.]MCC7091885.1 DUF3617 domain-containing protein [Nitrosomonas sp.]MXS76793.1 DUF3617 domain-containing protein [Nitrosomonas sp. JL21]
MFIRFISILIGLAITTASVADHHIRSGLWEISTQSELLAFVPHIPSDQMQQLNALAKRYGVKLPKVENGAVVSKLCITEEMAQQEIPTYFYENHSGCTVQNATRTGNRYKLDLVCNNKRFKGNGVAEGTFINPHRFEGSTELDSIIEGTPVPVHATVQGHWIGEHCTAVIPSQ